MSIDDKTDGDEAVMQDVFGSDRDRGGNDAPPEEELEIQPQAEAETPEAEAEPGEEPTSPGRDPSTGKFVPVSELVAERKKLKEARDHEAKLRADAEQRASQYEQRMLALMAQQAQPRQPAPQPPDPYTDPEGAFAYQQQMMSAQVLDNRLDASEFAVRAQFGDEVVDQALRAAKERGLTGPQSPFMQQRHPYKALVDWHKRESALAEIGPDPAAYKKQLADQIRAEVLAELKAGKGPQQRPQPRLPGTLADASSSGVQGTQMSDEALAKVLFGSERKRGLG